MEIIGIICEYNPFHNGHVYHLKQIKKLYPDSMIILCLNGYFMQRGEISLLTKEEKVKLSLEHNIDIVVELPFSFGTQSADYFAHASLKILSSLKITHLIFGSETKDLSSLEEIAQKQLKNDFQFKKNNTQNYPTALAKSLNQEKIFQPNDLLAISYIKEILKQKYNIIPLNIQRTSSYHDLKSNSKIISASNIRQKFKEGKNILKYVPFSDLKIISNIDEKKHFELLKYKILTSNHLNEYLDVIEGLENKLKKEINNSHSIQELILNVKSKRYTYNKIQRLLTHVLIGLQSPVEEISYIRILGFNEKGKQYLRNHKKEFLLPTTVDKNSMTYHFELLSSCIYDLITNQNTYLFEKKNQPIYMKEASLKESSQK